MFLSLDAGVDVEFCKLLIKAGARADLFDNDLDMAPIHAAVMSESTAHVRALLETHPLNKVYMFKKDDRINCKIKINRYRTKLNQFATVKIDLG